MKSAHPNSRLLFFGLNTVDLQFLVAAFPEKNTKTKATQNGVYVGGPATNAAVACAHLGGDVTLMTPIGRHVFSDFIVDDIERFGISLIDPIDHLPGKATFASIITEDENGDRTIFSYHPQMKLSEKVAVALDSNAYRAALFDGFYPVSARLMAERCRQQGIQTVLDGGSWKPGIRELVDYVDIAICSNDFRVPDGREPSTVFDYLHSRGVRRVAITRGDQSILFSENGTVGEVAVERIDAVDTLGAGDVFHGAFMFHLSLGASFRDALFEAGRVAGRSCLCFGTREWMRKPLSSSAGLTRTNACDTCGQAGSE